MQFLGDALAGLFCLWNMPQPASNNAQTLTQKSSCQQSPLEDDEQGEPCHLLIIEKTA